MNEFEAQVAADFSRARFKAFFNDIISLIARRSNELLSFAEVARRLKIRQRRYGGLRAVELDKIVGSVGRYRDFDRAFLPTQSHTQGKWKSVDRAHYQEIELPPVQLYKVGDVYFVRDGHHRVSVAREKGVKFIDAEVIECEARVPVTPDLRPEDLVIKGEYVDFLETTGLDRLRPDQKIEFSVPGNYRILLEHISVHRYFMGIEQEREIPWEEAVASWYDDVYMPIVRIIREQNILAEFPGRTEADLYLWIMDHLYFLRERYGPEVGAEEAAADFAERFSERPVKKALRGVKRAAEEIATETPLPAVGADETLITPVPPTVEALVEEAEEGQEEG